MAEMDYWKKYWQSTSHFKGENSHVKVGRTVFGKPIEEKNWRKTIAFIENKTGLSKDKTVLDLCCGNGLLSAPFSQKAKSVTSVDYSSVLIRELKSLKIKNVNAYAADVNELNLQDKSFDIIVFYFAVQHFSQTDTVVLLRKAKNWLKPGGNIYIGDIPDESRIWNFFKIKKYRDQYFAAIEKGEPIIGNWFAKEFFMYMSEYLDFKESEFIKQPKYMINHHYRFDVMMKN